MAVLLLFSQVFVWIWLLRVETVVAVISDAPTFAPTPLQDDPTVSCWYFDIIEDNKFGANQQVARAFFSKTSRFLSNPFYVESGVDEQKRYIMQKAILLTGFLIKLNMDKKMGLTMMDKNSIVWHCVCTHHSWRCMFE